MLLFSILWFILTPEISSKKYKWRPWRKKTGLEKIRPRYTGKNYEHNGLFEFVIENEDMRETLMSINENFRIDWLQSGVRKCLKPVFGQAACKTCAHAARSARGYACACNILEN